MAREALRSFGTGQKALPDIRDGTEALLEVQDGLEGPPIGPAWVERLSWVSEMGQEAL